MSSDARARWPYLGLSGLLMLMTSITLSAQPTQPAPARPVEPVAAIVEAFRSRPIVILGHPHGNEQKFAFQMALVRDPRFPVVVNDIVEECGNARYQDVMDRFIAGDDVPYATLRQIWENTISALPNCDLPMYEAFYRQVRDLNKALAPERRLRVVLGDVPIEWATVRSFDDVAAWDDQRETHFADVVRREVLAKRRRALVLVGDMHGARFHERTNYGSDVRLPTLLEADGHTKVFSVWQNLGTAKPDLSTIQPDVAQWPTPSLAHFSGTLLGRADYAAFFTSEGRLARVDGRVVAIPREQWKPMRMEEQFDAVLYLGPVSAMSFQRLSAERCAQAGYLEMRTARMALVPGLEPAIARLRQHCKSVAPK